MSVATRPRLMTAEELERLPDDGYHYELLRGELIRMPLAGGEHGGLVAHIGSLLRSHVRAQGLGKVVVETGYRLARDPDTVRA